ncbi:MAG: NADPH dehydrogenase NamA [Chloroflexi bacterium]|nr:NADPH dehydrogenase NamA [Chloroflexota bacterium]
MPHLFDPFTLRGVTFRNRIAMSPMNQYSAGNDGMPTHWHYLHYPTRAVGGVGLIVLEQTAIDRCGRNTEEDLGIWDDCHVEPLSRLVELCHKHGAKVGVQLNHGGRKAWNFSKGFGPAELVAPSAIPYDQSWNVPRALTTEEVGQIVNSFTSAARRARQAGFDVIEIHGGHGFLIAQFLSPLSNHRQDEYGESLQGRMRMLHQVVESVRDVWPQSAPLFVRVSASDFTPGGMDIAQMVEIARTLRERGVDLVDCSAGGLLPASVPAGPGYQVPFAHRIRSEVGIPTAAVGLISSPELADEIIANERADLVFLGRELLRNPYWPLGAAATLRAEVEWPMQYQKAKR